MKLARRITLRSFLARLILFDRRCMPVVSFSPFAMRRAGRKIFLNGRIIHFD